MAVRETIKNAKIAKVRLGDVCVVEFGTRIRSKDATSSAYPVYGGGGKTFDWETFNRENQYVVSRFAMSPECVRKVQGKFFLNDSGLTVRVISDSVSQDFVDRYLLGNQAKIYALGRGCAQKNLHIESFKRLEFPLPPLLEQKRIAEELDRICELKKNAEERLALMDQLVKSRFVEMFGDGSKCRLVRVGDLAAKEKNAFKAGPFGSALKKEYYVKAGYKIYGQEQVISGDPDLGDYYIDENRYRDLENCKVQAGDVLVSLVGTYGKTLIMPDDFHPGIINPRLLKLTFDKDLMLPRFFQEYFSLDSTRRLLDRSCHGCTMGVLNLGIVKNLQIPLPPLAFQREFAAFVAEVDKSKYVLRETVAKMETLYKTKLQEYFG